MPSADHRNRDPKSDTMAAAYQHFRRPIPTAIDPDNRSRDIQRAVSYLHILGDLPVHVRQEASLRRATAIDYEKNWPFVWSRTRTLLKQCVIQNEPTTAKGMDFRDMFPKIVSFHSASTTWCDLDHMSTLSLMQSTPDLFPLMIQTWKFCVDHEHPYLTINFLLFNLSFNLSKADASLFSQHCNLISRPEVVKPLLSYIRTEARRKDIMKSGPLEYAFMIISTLTQASRKCMDVLIAYDTLDCLA
ncbi:hypothetical protein D9758_009105 [Tetrapyrgos nigripes]|uniref:Uncharacterized protein n=1 Tax=Tetrapyrgos nigripes TaxID=182062 RepID=A0A8H5G8I0_9AGAR|nr:hypothetical protein D9758_009105 [Tetrapyrgos nigripes]